MKAVDKERSRKQISYFRATRLRRRETAERFRAKLLAELNGSASTASRLALVEVAVSAYVQVSESTGTFVRGYATPERVKQLGLARGQLQRALRALGLVEHDEEDAPPQTVEELLAPYRMRKETDDAVPAH